MRVRFAVCIPVLALAGVWLLPAAAQDGLPPGTGRDEARKACGSCHGVDTFLGLRRSQEDWDTTVTTMISFGMTISDEDYDKVVTYLTTWFGRTPRPVASH